MSSRSAPADAKSRKACDALVVRPGTLGACGVGDGAVAERDQMVQHGPHTAPVVEGERRDVLEVAVRQHERGLRREFQDLLVGCAGGAEDDAVDLLDQAADDLGFNRRILVGVGNEDRIAGCPGPGLHALADRAEEGVLEVGHDEAEAVLPAGDERAGVVVDAVAHALGRGLNVQPGCLGDLVWRSQRARHGGDGNAGLTSNIADRHSHAHTTSCGFGSALLCLV